MLRIYVFYNIYAEVSGKGIKLFIENPVELLSLEAFQRKTNLKEFQRRVKELKRLYAEGREETVQLADLNCPVRLGGGFAQLEANNLILLKRDELATRMHGALDIPAGLFDEQWRTPLEMMFAESVEVLRLYDSFLAYPQIAEYEDVIIRELEDISGKLRQMGVYVEEFKGLPSKILEMKSPLVEVAYENEKMHDVALAFEYDKGPSIELVGLLDVENPGYEFRYSDGEIGPHGSLLNREVHIIDLTTMHARVWRFFKVEKEGIVKDMLNKKLTSKAAFVLVKLKLIDEAHLGNYLGRGTSWELIL